MSTMRCHLVMVKTVSIVTIPFFVLVSLVTLGILLLRYRTGPHLAGQRPFKALGVRMCLTNEVDPVLIDANDRTVISPQPAGPFVAGETRALTVCGEKIRTLPEDPIHG